MAATLCRCACGCRRARRKAGVHLHQACTTDGYARRPARGSDNGTAHRMLWKYDRAAFGRHQRHLVADRGTLDCACGGLISPARHVCDIWDCMLSALQRMICTCSMHNGVQCGERAVNRSSWPHDTLRLVPASCLLLPSVPRDACEMHLAGSLLFICCHRVR